MSIQNYLKNQFYDLILKKSITVSASGIDCDVEIVDAGNTLCLLSLLYQSNQGFSESFLQHVEELEEKGLLVDLQKGQVLLARKHPFQSMSPAHFSLRLAQFVSEIQNYRKDIDEFKGKEYAFVKKS
ncbi:MAG: hypothetical protein S4CHLAM7_10910 [Chlamydiae bacterium]|nr:hypothetical protein [Chlamydiota bacterium]